jgi:hypothetical protein
MKRILLPLALPMLLGLLMLAGSVNPANAQKKKQDAAAQMQVKSGATIREVLQKLQGQMTNLGTLTKLQGDYVVFENEGDTLMYPLSALQVVKFLKAEEGEARKIEIKFLARD